MEQNIFPEIVVIAGEQAGARTRLKDNTTLTLSNKIDTDIVLRDPQIGNTRLKIITQHLKPSIEVIDGAVKVDNKVIEQGSRIRLPDYTKVEIGETAFVTARMNHASWEEISNLASINMPQAATKSNPAHRYRWHNNIFLSLLALITVLTVIATTVTNTMESSEMISMSNRENIHSLLIENGYESLQVDEQNDYYVIHGFVMTYNERAQLENLIDEHSVPAKLYLEVGDQLAIEVRELYRINGIEVSTKASAAGKVTVAVKSPVSSELERVKEMALNEITHLHALEIEYAVSEDGTQIIGTDMKFNAADKRITMVVDGDPAYIMTSDQSKYYIGAMLPTGHKIIDIIDQQVVLEKQGKQKTLIF